MLIGLTFRRKILICIVELLKVFLHPPPPLEREIPIRIVKLTIPKVTTLSIKKGDCENYLFKDYRLNLE